MSDQVVFHTGEGVEEAKKELANAEAALDKIGKKGLLERQSTHDKKVADAQAAVDAAKAKLAQLSGGSQAVETKAETTTHATTAAPTSSSSDSVEVAAERIRKLKAENAPQIEVRAAVEAHALEQANALKAAGAPQAEVKAAVLNYIALTEDPLVLTPIEVAKKKVRMLKANEASQDEVKAAVEAYVALVGAESKEAPAAASEPKAETKATEAHHETPASVSHDAPKAEAPKASSAPTTVEEAAERVRTLKAAKAPQAEVKAAVEAYVALTEAAPRAESKATVVPVSQTPVEAAAEKVRSLKAAKAPQAEVKAAVEAYIALTEGGSKTESKASVVSVQQTPVEAAAEKVRQLKAAKAPQPEVKAAVEAYLALTGGSQSGSAPQSASAPAAAEVKAESKAHTDLEAAAERVKSLKASKAPQAEVKAAVEAYIIEEAKDKVQKLKAAKAPQAEVKAAVEAYIALTEPAKSSESHATPAAEPTAAASEEDAPAVKMHVADDQN